MNANHSNSDTVGISLGPSIENQKHAEGLGHRYFEFMERCIFGAYYAIFVFLKGIILFIRNPNEFPGVSTAILFSFIYILISCK